MPFDSFANDCNNSPPLTAGEEILNQASAGNRDSTKRATGPVPRILVFGECLIDWFGDRGISGGAPCNVARHLGALGLRPVFLTRLGSDADGAALRAELERFGVHTWAVQTDPRHPTGRVLVHERDSGHEFEILRDQAYDFIEVPRDCSAFAGSPAAPTWLYFGTLAQRHAQSRSALQALRLGIIHRAFVDLNWRAGTTTQSLARSTLMQADELKVSADELGLLLQWAGLASPHTQSAPTPGTQCPGVAGLLLGKRVAHLLVTYGAGGYALFDSAGICRDSNEGARRQALVDTVGAGDAFSAIALAGLALGWPRKTALDRANEFAGAICGVRGAVPDDLVFYEGWRQRWEVAPAR